MSHSLRRVFFIAALLSSLPILAGDDRPKGQAGGEPGASDTLTAVVDLKALSTMDQLIERLASKQVIFVGESHDRYEDHLDQLAVIEGLHRKGKDLAIGMEMFQQPFQSYLDAYVKGEISEKELLRKTEYFDRWRFDYRLYRPILRFAREHRIPLVALNLEKEITGKVGKGGLSSLSPQERARIPSDIERDDQDYRERIKTVFEQHPGADEKDFEHFLEVQLLWDEGMAERAAVCLREHPGKTLIVLTGTGHLEYGQGIPRRLLRRVPVESAILLDGKQRGPDPEIADFLLYPQPVPLPASGQLGVLLDMDSKGEGIAVKGFAESSGAEDAGMEEGDRILAVGGEPVTSYSDIRIALLGRNPGEKLPIEVLRKHLFGRGERLTLEVQLH